MSKELALSVASAINMAPSLIHVTSASQVSTVLQSLAVAKIDEEQALMHARRGELLQSYGLSYDREGPQAQKPFAFAQGLAVIPVHGLLINRFGRSYGWVTGYNFIRAQQEAAEADPDVKGIVYDFNTYGGMVAGCFETAADIAALSKPTLALVDHAAYSAGMALASGAKRIVATSSAGVGSVGVITMHVSFEKLLDEAGIKITIMHAGKHKADGNPYQDLPEAVRTKTEADLETLRKEFASLVAANRGVDVQKILDTEARTYRADEAVSMGLIDAVATPVKAVAAFLNELSGSQQNSGATMGAENNADSSAAATNEKDVKAAVAADRQRSLAIMGCEEAKGKQALANHIAFNTEMSVDEAKAMLKLAATEAPAPAATTTERNPLAEAMERHGSPKVGADLGGGGANAGKDPNDENGQGAALLASYIQIHPEAAQRH